jgi:hypothetical protein
LHCSLLPLLNPFQKNVSMEQNFEMPVDYRFS